MRTGHRDAAIFRMRRRVSINHWECPTRPSDLAGAGLIHPAACRFRASYFGAAATSITAPSPAVTVRKPAARATYRATNPYIGVLVAVPPTGCKAYASRCSALEVQRPADVDSVF